MPNNNFPSLHVSFAFLCYFCMRRYRPRLALPTLILAIAVSASTVLVKQHYVADVLGAIPVAWAVNYFFLERFKRPFKKVHSSHQ
jgi:membrane-associated phospholipid phosphatase